MIDLERTLSDLAVHIDAPTGDDLVANVRETLSQRATISGRDHNRQHMQFAKRRRTGIPLAGRIAMSLIITALVLGVAIAPTRRAVARWLGIGVVSIRSSTIGELPTGQHPVASSTPRNQDPLDVQRVVQLAATRFGHGIATPALRQFGPPIGAAIEQDRPILILHYASFTLVQIASTRDAIPILTKINGPGTHIQSVDVNGASGLWFSGSPHDIAYLDGNGGIAHDSIRRAGPVLLWAQGDTTFRIEGVHDLSVAQQIARFIS